MKQKRLLYLCLAVSLVLGLAACERAIPGTEKTNNPTTAPVTLPAPGTDVLGGLQLFVTQTAMAAQITPGAPEALPTQPAVSAPEQGVPSEEAPAAPGDTVEAPSVEAPPVEAPTEAPPPAEPTRVVIEAPTPTPGLPSNYTIKSGEFPFCLARRFNIDPGDLLRANGMGSAQAVFEPGTTLKIPQNANPFPGKRSLRAHPATYTVSAGETIYSIACIFGDVDPSAIAFVNGLKSPYKLSAGDTIDIP